jgi:hydroxymethylpyrimidine kinase/phosphomethylpyrimidine kinase
VKWGLLLPQVMVSTSGSQLLPREAVQSVVDELLPLSYMITPNYPEALLLAQTAGKPFKEVKTVDGLIELAKYLHTLGPKIVFLKGGHCAFNAAGVFADVEEEKKTITDVFYDGGEPVVIENKYISSQHTHGTGCSLSAAIASQIALGETALCACQKAVDYVAAGIENSPGLGKGRGPIAHVHSTYTLPYPPYEPH